MEKIYSKFVKERKKEFQIETAIWKNENGKFITKRNLHKEGECHIQNIYDTFLMYQDKQILCKASLDGNVISFEYVSGNTLEEVFLESVKSGKKENVLEAVQKYEQILSLLCSEKEQADISRETEFTEVFGAPAGSFTGYRNMIFDLTFDNIICQGQSNRVIDYEWRFPFAVEKEFIKFRAVYAFLMKYSENINYLFTKEEFYEVFGLDISKCEIYMEYNRNFINYIYGNEGYNYILERYKKTTMTVCDERSLKMLKIYAIDNDILYENRTYELLLNSIREHRELYDDYHKFFKVTDKVKAISVVGYLFSKEFYEEFGAYIKDFYDMLEYYKHESEQKQKVIDEMSDMLEVKIQENIVLEEKYSHDCEALTNQIRSLEAKLEYIQSCKAYKTFLQKKVEERFK